MGKIKFLITIGLFLLSFLTIKSQVNEKMDYTKSQLSAQKDSLVGFDEQSLKLKYSSHGVSGVEWVYFSSQLKRDFINKKYNLVKSQVAQSTSNLRPKVIGGGNQVNVAPCVNEDFESTTPGNYSGTSSSGITGWSIYNQAHNSCVTNTVWSPGSPKIWVLTTPITGIPALGTLPASPLGGNNIIQMGNTVTPSQVAGKLSTTFPVTFANTLFQFAFAGVWNDGGHSCCEQPHLDVKMYDCLGAPLACSNITLNAQGTGCPNGAPGYSVSGGLSYTTWQVKYIDLTPFIGTCVTIEFINTDCIFSGHYGMVFIDAKCGGQLIGTGIPGPGQFIAGPISFCAGSNQAQIAAPTGYSTYQWYGPSGLIPPPSGTLSTLFISNPTTGTTYSVVMTSPSGCLFTSVNTLSFTSVNIAGTNTTATCPGGSSGSAIVYGNGSGAGYSYTWTNSSNSVVGTQSVVTGLPAGTYTINISACGSASTTVTIPSQSVPLTTFIKPYCTNTAFFNVQGSNIQWYNGTTATSTLPSYSITNPTNGGFVYVRYTSNQGCQDSIKFIMSQTTPGSLSLLSNKLICPGATNGSVTLGMIPAQGAPPGFYSYSVTSTGTTPPYSSSVSFVGATQYTAGNLVSGGTYSVNAFDGSCSYSISVTPTVHIWNYNLSSSQYTFCPGGQSAIGVSYTTSTSPTEYSYQWSPTTWLASGISQNNIISPAIAAGTQSTIVYSVLVTPTVSTCSITKTISITAINPAIPIISQIPPLCNTSLGYSIMVTPTGGTFNTSPISSLGVINPSISNNGINTFTYSTSVYTCIASKTATYQVSQFISSSLSSSVPPLCVTSAPFNLMNIVSSTSGTWTGQGVTSNVFNPVGLSTSPYVIQYMTSSNPNPTVCPSVTNLTVMVTNTLVPYITPVAPFCNNSPSFTLSVSPSGGSWLGSSVNNFGVVTPSTITSNLTNVSYSVNIGPCLNTSSISLSTSFFNTASFSGLPGLCATGNTVNLMTIVQNTLGSWSGQNVSNNILSPSLLNGNYILTYYNPSSPNPSLCPDTKTMSVNVLNPITPTITSFGPVCSNGSPIQMSVTPTNGNWVSSSNVSSNGIFTPSLSMIGNNNITYIVGTSTCNSQETKVISVEGFIPANITGNIPEQCNTNSNFGLNPYVLNSVGVWSGVGTIGGFFSPSIAGVGTHIITYNTQSVPTGVCVDMDTITVRVYQLDNPVILSVTPLCNKSMPIQLNVTPVGGIFSGLNNNGVTSSGIFNPANALIGINTIGYSVTSGPCIAFTQTTINVEEFISADFGKNIPPMCVNNLPINLNSIVINPGGMWSGDGMIGSMFTPQSAKIGYNRVVYQTNSSTNLCPDTKEILIIVQNPFDIKTTISSKEGCSPLEVVVSISNTNFGDVRWLFGNGVEGSGLSSSYIYTKPGNYNINVSFDDGVCASVQSNIRDIKVYETPKADFDIISSFKLSELPITVDNKTENLGNYKYTWKLDGNLFSNDVNPELTISKAGNYRVLLVATSINNCKSEISKNIEAKNDFNLFIPNSFSPNNDNLNDDFKPVFYVYGTVSFKNYQMEIFDRWGENLFSTTNIDNGWNGKFKGQDSKEESYVYRIQFTDPTGLRWNKWGHFTLLR